MFDIIVIFIMVISILMALFRGFVKEFFTIVSWILATLLTIYLSPVLKNLFPEAEGKQAFYDAISILMVFSISMIVFSFVFGRFMTIMKKQNSMFLDRSLGILFGIIRGALLICLGYIFIVGFMYDTKPSWIKGKTVKLIEIGSSQLIKLNPKDMSIDLFSKDDKEKIRGVKAMVDPKTYITEDLMKTNNGYSDEVRDRMKELIENDILQ